MNECFSWNAETDAGSGATNATFLAAEAMNSFPIHIAGESSKGVIPETRTVESSKESSSSFSQHLQEAVAARPEAVSRNEDVRMRAPAAKPRVSGAGKTVTSIVPERGTGHPHSIGARGAVNDGRFKKTENASPRAADSTGEQDLETDGPEDGRPQTSVSPSRAEAQAQAQANGQSEAQADGQSEAQSSGQSSSAQLAAGYVGRPSCSKAGCGTPDKPSQAFLALGALAGTQVATPASTSCDFTLAVTQPIAPAEANSAEVNAEPKNGPVEPGSSGETAPPQNGSKDVAAGSSSPAENAVVAGNNNSAVTMNSDLTNSLLDQINSADPAIAVEAPPVESHTATDAQEATQDSPRSAEESATMKSSASHNASSVATLDFGGLASPAPAGFTGSPKVSEPVEAIPGNRSVEPASSGRRSDRDAEAGSSSHPSTASTPNSPAPGTESAPSDQASPRPVPPSTWDGVPSMSFKVPLAEASGIMTGRQSGEGAASGITTGGQSGAAGSSDHPLAGAPILNVTSFGSHSSTSVPFQIESGGGVVPDSSAKSPAQAEGTPRPMQDGVVEAWQNVAAHMERVNGATLNSLANGTEMRVQLHTDAFGPLEIRATLEAGRIGAAIGVENAEAHHTLLDQVSALQQSLADKHVQLDQVTVVKTSGQNSTDLGWNPNQQRDDSAQYSRLAQQANGRGLASEPALALEAEVSPTEIQWGRLSVRA